MQTLDYACCRRRWRARFPPATLVGDKLSLLFPATDGTDHTTNRSADVLDRVAGVVNLATALRSLPGGAVSDVAVTGSVPSARSVH